MGEIEDEWIIKKEGQVSRNAPRNGSMNLDQEDRQDNWECDVRQEKLPRISVPHAEAHRFFLG